MCHYSLPDNAARVEKAACLRKLITRCKFLKATVALTNKLIRIIWRVLRSKVDFNMQKYFAIS
ncbi:hypothetical protein D3790_17410 [Xenorhabdus nematophila]|nr:hypothetical protein D3790_17410 [Xenorhabdus nematophila]